MIYFNMIVALFIKHLQVLTYYSIILFPGNGTTVAFILLSFMKKYTDESQITITRRDIMIAFCSQFFSMITRRISRFLMYSLCIEH